MQRTISAGPTGPLQHGRLQAAPFLTGKDGLSGLLKAFHLDYVDPGDILLLLILLYLLVEGDDMDLVIALGLVLLMGLGENGKKDG